MEFSKYKDILFFIDEKGYVQIIHTETPNVGDIEKLNKYYGLHIKVKIGYPDFEGKDDQQVKVTFVKNNLTYEDTKFAGKGLFEYFVKEDISFTTLDQ